VYAGGDSSHWYSPSASPPTGHNVTRILVTFGPGFFVFAQTAFEGVFACTRQHMCGLRPPSRRSACRDRSRDGTEATTCRNIEGARAVNRSEPRRSIAFLAGEPPPGSALLPTIDTAWQPSSDAVFGVSVRRTAWQPCGLTVSRTCTVRCLPRARTASAAMRRSSARCAGGGTRREKHCCQRSPRGSSRAAVPAGRGGPAARHARNGNGETCAVAESALTG